MAEVTGSLSGDNTAYPVTLAQKVKCVNASKQTGPGGGVSESRQLSLRIRKRCNSGRPTNNGPHVWSPGGLQRLATLIPSSALRLPTNARSPSPRVSSVAPPPPCFATHKSGNGAEYVPSDYAQNCTTRTRAHSHIKGAGSSHICPVCTTARAGAH